MSFMNEQAKKEKPSNLSGQVPKQLSFLEGKDSSKKRGDWSQWHRTQNRQQNYKYREER